MAPARPGHGGAAAARAFAAVGGETAQRSKRLKRKEKRKKALAQAAQQNKNAANGGMQCSGGETQEGAKRPIVKTVNKQPFKQTKPLKKKKAKQNKNATNGGTACNGGKTQEVATHPIVKTLNKQRSKQFKPLRKKKIKVEAAPDRIVRTWRKTTANRFRARQDKLRKVMLKRKKPLTRRGGFRPLAELQEGRVDAHAKAKTNSRCWKRKERRITADPQLPSVQELEWQLRVNQAVAEENIANEQLAAAALAYTTAKRRRLQLEREMQGLTQPFPTQAAEMQVAEPTSRQEQVTSEAADAEAHDQPEVTCSTPVTSMRNVPATPPLTAKASASKKRNLASTEANSVKQASSMCVSGENTDHQVVAGTVPPPANGAERPSEVTPPANLMQQEEQPQQPDCAHEDKVVVEDAQGESRDVINWQSNLNQPQGQQDEQHAKISHSNRADAGNEQEAGAGRTEQAPDAVSEVGSVDKRTVGHDGRTFGNLPRPVAARYYLPGQIAQKSHAALNRMQAAEELRATRYAHLGPNQHMPGKGDARTEGDIDVTLKATLDTVAHKAAVMYEHSQYLQRLKAAIASAFGDTAKGDGDLRPKGSRRAPAVDRGQPSKMCATAQPCDAHNERPDASPHAERSEHRMELLPTTSPQLLGKRPQSSTELHGHVMPVESESWVGSADIARALEGANAAQQNSADAATSACFAATNWAKCVQPARGSHRADSALNPHEAEIESPQLVVNSTAPAASDHGKQLPAQLLGTEQKGLLPSAAVDVEAHTPRPAGSDEQQHSRVLTSACKSQRNSLEDTLSLNAGPSHSELQDDAECPLQIVPPGPVAKRRRLVKLSALQHARQGS